MMRRVVLAIMIVVASVAFVVPGFTPALAGDAPEGTSAIFRSNSQFQIPINLPNLSLRFKDDGTLVQQIVNFLIRLLLWIGGAVALVYVFIGGYRYMTAGPDPAKLDSAKRTIIGAVVGIFIIALAYFAVQFVIDTIKSIAGS